MNLPNFDSVQVGDMLPPLQKPPITRHTLALFCGASNDHNPIHVDIDFARAAGMPDVFAHGMLSMAYLGQLLTHWVPQSALRSFAVRFSSITQLKDSITCQGRITEKFVDNGEHRARIELKAVNQDNDVKLIGEAVVALGH
ncbi:dehydratase [Sinimarinibacterium sp. CAU 1509]|uniref:MaoC family dehydratase n=1 Tax=Sinimarinibacterium sp. CAU 1509 TaxID=2562283 RepID=UPI0010AC5D98|nr:MaoC family dehydratase [Sinimarinibacterium sp. CAU 1509]TJY62973.1 dehydratase [Sinimarinibacterium sp. CAU 1509]